MESANIPNLLLGFMGILGILAATALVLLFYVTNDEVSKSGKGGAK